VRRKEEKTRGEVKDEKDRKEKGMEEVNRGTFTGRTVSDNIEKTRRLSYGHTWYFLFHS
jgi:hypothetical protein